MIKPNTYKGYCQCGKFVPAGEGFFRDGWVFCETPNDTNHCPTHQAQVDEYLRKKEEMENTWIAQMKQEQLDRFFGRHRDDGTCGRCDGDGRYIYYTGVIGVCYTCGGTGKIKPRKANK